VEVVPFIKWILDLILLKIMDSNSGNILKVEVKPKTKTGSHHLALAASAMFMRRSE